MDYENFNVKMEDMRRFKGFQGYFEGVTRVLKKLRGFQERLENMMRLRDL